MPIASQTKEHSSDQTPFDQVRIAEERESARVEETKKKLEHSAQKELRRIEEQAVKRMEDARSAADRELEEFAGSEPAALLRQSKADAAKEVQAIDKATPSDRSP